MNGIFKIRDVIFELQLDFDCNLYLFFFTHLIKLKK